MIKLPYTITISATCETDAGMEAAKSALEAMKFEAINLEKEEVEDEIHRDGDLYKCVKTYRYVNATKSSELRATMENKELENLLNRAFISVLLGVKGVQEVWVEAYCDIDPAWASTWGRKVQ
jgi:hypothetical protein